MVLPVGLFRHRFADEAVVRPVGVDALFAVEKSERSRSGGIIAARRCRAVAGSVIDRDRTLAAARAVDRNGRAAAVFQRQVTRRAETQIAGDGGEAFAGAVGIDDALYFGLRKSAVVERQFVYQTAKMS